MKLSSLFNKFKVKFKEFMFKLVLAEQSVNKLTLSFCLGTFIALSATIPLQTPLIFILSWLLGLNTTVTFTTVYVVNNPLTMVPIYIADYAFGNWLFQSVLNIDMSEYNPSWVDKFSNFLNKYINLESILGESVFCFWCLIIGGLILPFIISAILYPLVKPVFSKMVKKIHKQDSNLNINKKI